MKFIQRIGETLLITEGEGKRVKIIDERKVDSKKYFQLVFDEGEKLGSGKDHTMYLYFR